MFEEVDCVIRLILLVYGAVCEWECKVFVYRFVEENWFLVDVYYLSAKSGVCELLRRLFVEEDLSGDGVD